MLIGSRMTHGTATSEIAARAAGKYVDVVSINYYALAIEKAFLQRVHEQCGGNRFC